MEGLAVKVELPVIWVVKVQTVLTAEMVRMAAARATPPAGLVVRAEQTLILLVNFIFRERKRNVIRACRTR